MPTLRQWEYVVRVAEIGSFTQAAAELFVSQPGLSHQIAALETELGGAVFDRLRRGVTLTPLGRAVLPHAKVLVAESRRATAAAAAVLGTTGGSLEVMTITSLGLGVLPGILEAWLDHHPDVAVTLTELNTVDAVAAAMQAGSGDVAVTPLPTDWAGRSTVVGTEELVVVARAGHPAAGERTSLTRFADSSWVQYAPGHGLAGVVESLAAEAGFTPRIAMRTSQTAAVPRFAAAGVGVAVVPANVLDASFQGEIIFLDPPCRRVIHAYTRTVPDPLVAAFIDSVVKHANLAGPFGRG